jgi:hypothetical protein
MYLAEILAENAVHYHPSTSALNGFLVLSETKQPQIKIEMPNHSKS